MKKNDLNNMRKKKKEDIEKTLVKKLEELEKTKMDMSLGQESNLKKVKMLKKDVAQLKTLIREKEIVKASKVKDSDEKGEEK